jgi:hypothetical protein
LSRDIAHLDAVMARARDVTSLSMILSRICGADRLFAKRVFEASEASPRVFDHAFLPSLVRAGDMAGAPGSRGSGLRRCRR